MAKSTANSPQAVMEQIEKGTIAPVYLLMGEEAYYIDAITDALIHKLIDSSAQDFDLSLMYGKDVSMGDVIMMARQYPMMSQRKVVVLKEGQQCSKFDEGLSAYLQQPLQTTVLIINYKNGTVDKRKKAYQDLLKYEVVVESRKLYDNEIPDWIQRQVQRMGLKIDVKSAQMLTDFIGNDLSRIVGELEKLRLTMPAGSNQIHPELIERNIGISKEYNDFELLNALINRDVFKANRIAKHFAANPRNYPLIKTLAAFAYFFTNLMYYHYLVDKNPAKAAPELGVAPMRVKEYAQAAQFLNARKTMDVIRMLRFYDAKSKGMDSTNNQPEGDLLKELIYFILH